MFNMEETQNTVVDDTSCLAQNGERMDRLLVNIKIPISRRQSRVKYSPSETYTACIVKQLIHVFLANAKKTDWMKFHTSKETRVHVSLQFCLLQL